jgi:hypothetical protein
MGHYAVKHKYLSMSKYGMSVEARKALLLPYQEYRGFTIFRTPGYFCVIERPNWDDCFETLKEVKDYIDYCLEFNEIEAENL